MRPMEDVYRSQFRLPYPLYERLKVAADQSGRSVNAELVYRLGESLDRSDKAQSAAPEKLERSIVEGLADKLTQPAHRAELESLLATIYGLMDKKPPARKK
jgi:hypothetical protein